MFTVLTLLKNGEMDLREEKDFTHQHICFSRSLEYEVLLYSVCISCPLIGRGTVQWDFIHGLFESATYGGRVDNTFDMSIMMSYLQQFFQAQVLSEQSRGNKKLGPLRLPASSSYRVGHQK